jgi:hypothetical protein
MTILERLPQGHGEPAWEIARLFPVQGEWTVEDYLALSTNQLVEFSNGFVEVLPMPSPSHQRIVFFLQRMLWLFVTERRLGEVLSAPLPIELWSKNFVSQILFLCRKQNWPNNPPNSGAMLTWWWKSSVQTILGAIIKTNARNMRAPALPSTGLLIRKKKWSRYWCCRVTHITYMANSSRACN